MRDGLGPAEPTMDLEVRGTNASIQLVGDPADAVAATPARRPSANVDCRLYERDHVLSSMRSSLGHDRGFAGRLICIEGAPGLGKSALLNAFHHIADDAGLTVLRARCSEHEMEIPYVVARRLLAPSLGCGMDLASNDWMELDVPAGRAAGDLAAVYQGLNTLLGRFGRVLLAIDDVQWADPESVAWLQFVSRRLDMTEADIAVSTLPRQAGAPLGPVDRLSLEPAAELFVLQPLRPATTARVMQDRLGDVVTPELARTAHHLTGGNPFLLVALIDELATSESEPSPSDLLRLAPPAVMRWTLRRLSNLPSEAHDLLSAVSVLGPDADLRSAAAIAGIEMQARRRNCRSTRRCVHPDQRAPVELRQPPRPQQRVPRHLRGEKIGQASGRCSPVGGGRWCPGGSRFTPARDRTTESALDRRIALGSRSRCIHRRLGR